MTSIKTQNPHERYIDEFEDADAATNFNWQASNQEFPPRYGYVLTTMIEDHSGAGVGAAVSLQLESGGTIENGTNYAQLEWGGTGWQTNTRGQWVVGDSGTNEAIFAKVFIGGGQYVNAPSSTKPTMHVMMATGDGQRIGHSGRLAVNMNPIDGIRVFTTSAATGFAVLEGWGPIKQRSAKDR